MRPARKFLLRHGFAVTLEFCRLVQALEPPAPVRCIIAVNDTNGTFRRAALPSSTATPTARPRSRPRPWPRPARACGCWTSTARMQLAMAEWLRGRVAVAERAFAASITGRRAMGERSGRGCYWPGQKARQPRPGQARRGQPHPGRHPGPPARPNSLARHAPPIPGGTVVPGAVRRAPSCQGPACERFHRPCPPSGDAPSRRRRIPSPKNKHRRPYS